MSVIDTELPYSLIDLVFSFVLTLMSAVLMCLSAGYFAATMPPVILAVYGKDPSQPKSAKTHKPLSLAEVLFENLSPNAPPRSRSEISIVFSLP